TAPLPNLEPADCIHQRMDTFASFASVCQCVGAGHVCLPRRPMKHNSFTPNTEPATIRPEIVKGVLEVEPTFAFRFRIAYQTTNGPTLSSEGFAEVLPSAE